MTRPFKRQRRRSMMMPSSPDSLLSVFSLVAPTDGAVPTNSQQHQQRITSTISKPKNINNVNTNGTGGNRKVGPLESQRLNPNSESLRGMQQPSRRKKQQPVAFTGINDNQVNSNRKQDQDSISVESGAGFSDSRLYPIQPSASLLIPQPPRNQRKRSRQESVKYPAATTSTGHTGGNESTDYESTEADEGYVTLPTTRRTGADRSNHGDKRRITGQRRLPTNQNKPSGTHIASGGTRTSNGLRHPVVRTNASSRHDEFGPDEDDIECDGDDDNHRTNTQGVTRSIMGESSALYCPKFHDDGSGKKPPHADTIKFSIDVVRKHSKLSAKACAARGSGQHENSAARVMIASHRHAQIVMGRLRNRLRTTDLPTQYQRAMDSCNEQMDLINKHRRDDIQKISKLLMELERQRTLLEQQLAKKQAKYEQDRANLSRMEQTVDDGIHPLLDKYLVTNSGTMKNKGVNDRASQRSNVSFHVAPQGTTTAFLQKMAAEF